ncbi:MAG: FkbM family methyltransferase [Candidatus Methanofastidiosa archaeon]|jgi:FkbM family methyltransferase|nr:FkbM family methyltransferase [Candidatus Methanofastidiosa archaeon]
MIEIMDHFQSIIKNSDAPVIFEFGTCEGLQTKQMCNILKKHKKNFKYYAFEADPRIVPQFKINNQIHPEITFVQAAVGNKDGNVKFYLSSGQESRPDKIKQEFYGSSSIRKPKETLSEFPDMQFQPCIIPSIRFDTYYDKVQPGIIDFIWADIQGAEIDLIEHGQKALSNTKYLYTEVYEQEMYEGEIGLDEILKKLPGKWSVVEKYDYDVLLKNESL